MLYASDNGVMKNLTERSYDIVGKWEDEERKEKEYKYQFQYRDTTLRRLKKRQDTLVSVYYGMCLNLKRVSIAQM